MSEGIIIYETFRKAQRQEKDNDALQKLPEEFYDACGEWTKRKEALFETTREPSILREIENVMAIIKDLMDRRERKVLTLAIHHVRSGAVPQNLLPSEREFFDTIVSGLESLKKTNIEKIRGASSKQQRIEPTIPPLETQGTHIKVVANGHMERFVGTDGKVYGPAESGDVLDVPADVGQLLLTKELAQKA